MNADNVREVEVRMPEMGESIAEGTIVRWMKHEGDTVARDESIVEIETDKAVAELPSPAAGIVSKILVAEEETVAVGTVIAIITAKDVAEAAAPSEPERVHPAPPRTEAKPQAERKPVETETPAAAKEDRSYDPFASAAARDMAAPPTIETRPATAAPSELVGGPVLSPIVSRLLADHGLSPDEITGTGLDGRITKKDVLDHLARRGQGAPSAAAMSSRTSKPSAQRQPRTEQKPSTESNASAEALATTQPTSAPRPVLQAGPDDRVVLLEGIRAAIADHLTASAAIPRVTTIAEVDMSACVALRAEHRAAFEQHGLKLTYIPMILSAVCRAVSEFPGVNASLTERQITYYKHVHLGVSVARPQGLVVVVIRQAETKTIAQLAAELRDLAQRARDGKLKPAETRGSTLTVTNPGSLGGILSTPLINAPEAAIVSIQAIQDRPVVVGGDTIVIRPMMYLALSYDHRIIDGAEAIGYLQSVKHQLETPEFDFTIT